MRPWLVLALVVLSGCFSPHRPPADEATMELPGLIIETDLGTMTLVLYPEAAPQTVALIQAYAEEGYYEGRAFYRVVPGHVIQVTDPAGGATDDPRTVPLETNASFHFSAGAAGIARGADPDSGGPEIFLMDFATSHLDGNYTVWGQVVAGLDVVHRAARVPAFEFPRLPDGTILGTTDRMAVEPATIVAVRSTTVRLPPEEAAHYPLRVAPNAVEGDFRHSLEWPADLRVGAKSDLTWYVRTYNGAEATLASQVAVRVEGIDHPAVGEAGTPGVYHFTWTPVRPGATQATLIVHDQETASLEVGAH